MIALRLDWFCRATSSTALECSGLRLLGRRCQLLGELVSSGLSAVSAGAESLSSKL